MKKSFLTALAFMLLSSLFVVALPLQAQTNPQATAQSTADPCGPNQTFVLFNLNTATQDNFLTIPNVNNRMVREFMEYRPYISITQFRRELGKYVSADQVTAWEKYVYVPVQVDDSDVATLMQIPGMTEAIAEQLIAARPYNNNKAFLTKLASYLTTEQVAFAKNYLDVDANATPEPTDMVEATLEATPCATEAATSAAATTSTFALANLNTATQDGFLTIPNVNNRMVREFMEYRPYISITQFRRELGKYVSSDQVTAWEKYVYVPVQVNDSDAATLMQIPGVTQQIASDLMTARPYNDNAAFLTKLASYLTADQIAFAQNYLEQ